MAHIKFFLSLKKREDGKQQLYVRVDDKRAGARPRLKTGVFVSEEFWQDGSVVVPQLRKLNRDKVEEARAEQSALNKYLENLTAILIAAQDAHILATKAWIEDAFRVLPKLQVLYTEKKIRKNLAGSFVTAQNIEYVLAVEKEEKEREEKEREEEKKRRESEKTLYDYIPMYCKRRGLAFSRVRVFHVIQKMLARYEMFVRETENPDYRLSVSTLKAEDIEAFRDYIRDEANLMCRHKSVFAKIMKALPYKVKHGFLISRRVTARGENYVITTMKRLKAVCNWLYDMGITSARPFDSVNIGTERYGSPIYINIEERNTIADFDLSAYNKTIQEQRDVFIFQCCIGCRVGDLYTLSEANIRDGILRYIPSKTESKTNVEAIVPLSNRAMAIVEKYKGQKYILPFISEQKYNKAIKDIFLICGITRNVLWRNPTTGKEEVRPINEIASSHMARRTFVGAAYKQVKDPNIVGKMSGHVEGSKAFARYRNIDEDILREVVAAIE